MSNEHDRAILNCIFNPFLPVGESIYDEELPANFKDDEENTPETETAKSLEVEGIKFAECGNLDTAIGRFTRGINIAPHRPSGYNNRAQTYRIKGNTVEAIADLDKAIDLSKGQGRSGCQALCQRGIIRRKEGQVDLAREDFQAAADLGSQFAKVQLVELNPYAALCNQMLYEVMGKLREEKV